MIQKQNQKKSQINLEAENKKLIEELEKVKRESGDFKNKYLRALADYQNYEKRVSEEKMQADKIANIALFLKLLPFIDSLEQAEIFIKDQGLKIVKDKFQAMLRETGLEEIQVLGRPFDPHVAEAVEVVQGKEDNIIKEVLRKGYRYNEKVLRVAQVRVSKKSEARNPKPQINSNL